MMNVAMDGRRAAIGRQNALEALEALAFGHGAGG